MTDHPTPPYPSAEAEALAQCMRLHAEHLSRNPGDELNSEHLGVITQALALFDRRAAEIQTARQPDDPPEQWIPMSMEDYLSTLADRMEGVARREGSGGLLKTSENLRKQAAEVALHGTTVDPLMVLIIQQKLFQEGGTYGPPGSKAKGSIPGVEFGHSVEAAAATHPENLEPEAGASILELANPAFPTSKLSELEPWLRNEDPA